MTSRAPLPQWLEDKLTEETAAGNNNGYFDMAGALAGVPEGERDEQMFRLACSLRAKDVPRDMAEGVVLYAANNCDPSFPEDEALQKVTNAYERYEAGNNSSQHSHSLKGTGIPGMKNLKEDLQAHIVSLHEVERPRQREWIWEGYIPKEHLSLIYGEGGKAKSLLALHLATSVAAEGVTTWLERGIITGGVLYVDFELSLDEQTRRAYEIASGLGLERPPKNLMLFPAGVFPRAAVFHTIRLFCEKHGIDLVIIDSLGMALEGDAESSRDVIGFFQRYITPILDTGATVLGVDHQAKRIKGDRYKDKTVFGSVYKTNLARSVIQVDGDRTEDGVNVTLQHKKANVGCEQPMLAAKVKFESGKVVVERLLFSIEEDYSPESPPTTVDQVIEVLQERGAMFSADIEEATGLEKKTVQNVLSTLRRSGRVEDTGNKKGNAREVQIVNHSQHSQPIKGMGTAGTNSLFSDDGDLALGLKQEGRVLPSDAPPGVYETIEEFRAGKPTKTTEDLAREQAARER